MITLLCVIFIGGMVATFGYFALVIIEIYNDAARTAAEYELDRESPIPRKVQK